MTCGPESLRLVWICGLESPLWGHLRTRITTLRTICGPESPFFTSKLRPAGQNHHFFCLTCGLESLLFGHLQCRGRYVTKWADMRLSMIYCTHRFLLPSSSKDVGLRVWCVRE